MGITWVTLVGELAAHGETTVFYFQFIFTAMKSYNFQVLLLLLLVFSPTVLGFSRKLKFGLDSTEASVFTEAPTEGSIPAGCDIKDRFGCSACTVEVLCKASDHCFWDADTDDLPDNAQMWHLVSTRCNYF